MGKKKSRVNANNDIFLTEPENTRTLENKLIWPLWGYDESNLYRDGYLGMFCENDSYVFPGLSAIDNNIETFNKALDSEIVLGIREFWETFAKCSDVILVDPHFSKNQYNRMIMQLDCMLRADKGSKRMCIRIYSSHGKELKGETHDLEKNHPDVYRQYEISIWHLPRKGIVHDRFAIMDGEIWHCGAAIGGMHGSLNAVSRGWQDVGDELKNFFLKKGEIVYGSKQ